MAAWTLRTFSCRELKFMKTIWKTIVLPHADYCSVLWFSPENISDIEELESCQRSFLRKIRGFSELNYWERLKSAGLYSVQRRLERYVIMYTWKAIEGITPNCGIEIFSSERRGRLCKIPAFFKSSKALQSIKEKSFQVQGPRLFNCLPQDLRNMTGCSKECFKVKLVIFLASIPDRPKTATLTPIGISQQTGKNSNSLPDAIRTI